MENWVEGILNCVDLIFKHERFHFFILTILCTSFLWDKNNEKHVVLSVL